MLNPFSLFSYLAEALFYNTWSLVAGLFFGSVLTAAIKQFKGAPVALSALALFVLSPIISSDNWLVRSLDINFKLNVFITGMSLAALLVVLVRTSLILVRATDPAPPHRGIKAL